MVKNKKRESFGVIGLGRFGLALAKALAKEGKDVIAIDWIFRCNLTSKSDSN